MQTPAERALVEHLVRILPGVSSDPAPLLAIGAGRSLSIEDQLTAADRSFTSDRVDVEDCAVDDPRVRRSWICSAESMDPVPDGEYAAAFANYVLEHVPDVRRAASEIARVLRQGGVFVASLPNPRALEFRVARATPLAFHEWIRGREAWETHYDYGSVRGLITRFEAAGFRTVEIRRWAFLEGYLHRFPGLGAVGRACDRTVQAARLRPLQGNVFAAFERIGPP